jgi:hypothetical protein
MDGPVVKAARQALDKEDVSLVLPYVKADATEAVKAAFEKALRTRKIDAAAREVADLYFFETVVRLHRAGEGAAYTGLKPAGLDVGPVIPLAEKAIETGSPDALVNLLTDTVRHQVKHRLERVKHLRAHAGHDVAKAREYVEAMLGLQVYAHHLYEAMKASPHEGDHQHG